MKEYIIKKITEKTLSPEHPGWEQVEALQVDCFPWKGYFEGIHTQVQLVYSDYGVTVRFITEERPLVSTKVEDNDYVCLDSCMEFFFRPEGEDRYMNFEMNPLGTVYSGFGAIGEREKIKLEKEKFLINSCIRPNQWVFHITIPWEFWSQYYGQCPERSFLANFYKCGNETGHQHYACWNPLLIEKPNFHRPDFFGRLLLEK